MALSVTVEGRKERKQFCAFSARPRFHTAWTRTGHVDRRSSARTIRHGAEEKPPPFALPASGIGAQMLRGRCDAMQLPKEPSAEPARSAGNNEHHPPSYVAAKPV